MNPETYYRDHWLAIERERLDAYESMFEWHPRLAPLLEPAGLAPGQTVLDFGCGPGGLALELARRVAPDGHVHGVDVNAEMVARATQRAGHERLTERLSFAQLTDETLPFADAHFDRVVCKSVLEYVTDPALTLAEFCRVTRPGGRVHVVDSDWDMLVVEPLADATLAALMAAAGAAYRTPRIGRKLFGLFRDAGLSDVTVSVLAAPDTAGLRAFVVRHMLGYARAAGRLGEHEASRIEASVAAAIRDGRYLMVLPQFVVTGTVANPKRKEG